MPGGRKKRRAAEDGGPYESEAVKLDFCIRDNEITGGVTITVELSPKETLEMERGGMIVVRDGGANFYKFNQEGLKRGEETEKGQGQEV